LRIDRRLLLLHRGHLSLEPSCIRLVGTLEILDYLFVRVNSALHLVLQIVVLLLVLRSLFLGLVFLNDCCVEVVPTAFQLKQHVRGQKTLSFVQLLALSRVLDRRNNL